MEYKQLTSYETDNEFGVKILVSGIEPSQEIKYLANRLTNQLFEAIWLERVMNEPSEIANRRVTILQLSSLFSELIHVEVIPNEYCLQPCCWSLPWLLVTTKKGDIKVGWRKRVINIDWGLSDIEETGHGLFPDEDVTKGDYNIHAWTCFKAKEYLEKLLR